MLTVQELGLLRLNDRLTGGREYWTPTLTIILTILLTSKLA